MEDLAGEANQQPALRDPFGERICAPFAECKMIFVTYGHLDVFMGKHAAKDTFPFILGALDETN